MASPKEHIEEIRRNKFSIGKELNPLTEDLHQAVKNLSAELYTKDVHFLMELIQNAEDNEYSEGVNPSLELIITSQDVTETGASTTLVIFNNEIGFSSKNIDSICSVGRSTKKNNRKRGYIGEKGIGFKSVFLITSHPYIFSNGYQIRFNEEPCSYCGVGYVVPEWVEDDSILSNIRKIYRPNVTTTTTTTLPTTTIVLPLKPDKIIPVKKQLSSIHPEVLLFLSKIKQLSVREVNEDPKSNTVSAIAISSETDFITRKNIDAQSYTLHLSSTESDCGIDSQCFYYMWKQRFPVKEENKVERRMGVEELVITLAFPNGERLIRGVNSPGVFAFLPTEMVTNFPFIIQADFVLSSSRETILLDNKWNQGILDCVPSAFVNAFISLVKTSEDAPLSCLPNIFSFLPIISSSYEKLNVVRELIKQKLLEQNIVPSHSLSKQKFFHKPREVGRILPAFWNILMKASDQGVSLLNLSSHGKYILSSALDKKEYDQVLSFLEVKPVNNEWYAKCIRGTNNIVRGVSEDVYLELLLFIADNWSSRFHVTDIINVPLVKYVSLDGNLSLCSVSECKPTGGREVHLARLDHLPWLNESNREFSFIANCYFMPETTQKSIQSCSRKLVLLQWLRDHVKVDTISVFQFANLLVNSLGYSRKHIITYVHFLYHSLSKTYLNAVEIYSLCHVMPVVDKYSAVIRNKQELLIPADGSKWAQLLVSNPWHNNGYVELGADYINPVRFAGESITRKQLIHFLTTHVKASDIPLISPPNTEISVVSSPLTMQNVLLLLDWIRSLKTRGIRIPEKFLKCIKEGCWLRINLNGYPGYRSPSQSFDLAPSWASILQNGSVLVDIPLIDHSFYDDQLKVYVEELKTIGVMFEYGEVLKFIGNHLMSLAAKSNLTRGNVYSILKFIRFLKHYPSEEFIVSIRKGTWIKTRNGYGSPVGSVLYDEKWRTASLVSNIPFIDQEYYGNEILSFREELKLLGVVVAFDLGTISQLVVSNLKPPSQLTSPGAEAFLLILQCLMESKSGNLVNICERVKCVKTNLGYKSPGECYLSDPDWGGILQVFNCFPLVDSDFYGSSIFSYRKELEKMGVMVDFEGAVKAFSKVFSQQVTKNSLKNGAAISFLSSYKKLKQKQTLKFPSDLKKCLKELKWLRTRLCDYRSPKDCILYDLSWESISPIALLPFIDDSKNCYGDRIHEYKGELKSMGVVTDFKDGAQMVAAGLYIPQDPVNIASSSVLSLLECIRTLLKKNYTFPDDFSKKVSQRWLKTNFGYRSPKESLLFWPGWDSYLKPTDGPFIDETFYTFDIESYKEELKEIGVTVDSDQGCQIVSCFLDCQIEFSSIVRIYTYLNEFNWKPENEAAKRIWIPNGNNNGHWINPEECVLFDKDDLFGLQLTVLESYYEPGLLGFFSKAFNVRAIPSMDDYCKLWKSWESNRDYLCHDECFKFWSYVTRHLNLKSERAFFSAAIAKVPAISESDGVYLFDKRDIFISDDLQLKDLFERLAPHPIFVWCPQPSSASLPRTKLLEVYKNIGVRNISESVKREEASVVDPTGLKHVKPDEVSIGIGLVRLILGFLADPAKKIESSKRQEFVQRLLDLSVFETAEPIMLNYSLSLTSGEIISAGASRWIRWERENSQFFSQKMDRLGGQMEIIKYATCFSEVISEGVLWENSDYIYALSELIKLAFVLNFDEEAVDFIMKSKNYEIFKEDEDFLSSAFTEKSK